MKKFIKRIVIALGVVLGLSLTFVGGVYASQYINWGGTNAYHNTLDTLEQIVTQGQTLKSERDTAIRGNEQLVNQIKDKENVIKDKENVIKDKENNIKALQKEIEDLKKNDKTAELEQKTKELEQAIKDMKHVDQKAKDALNSLK